MKKTLLTLALGMAFTTVTAQNVTEDAAEDVPEIKQYSVEVIIFTYEEDVYVGNEIFVPDPPPAVEGLLLDEDGNPIDADAADIPEFTDTMPVDATQEDPEEEEPPPQWIIVSPEDYEAFIASRIGQPDGESAADEVNPFQLVLLEEDEYMLGDALRQFELLEAYETLMHVAWTQQAFPEEETPAIDLSLFGEVPEDLTGTLTLYLSRYLHLVVDLALDAPVAPASEPENGSSFFNFGDSRIGYVDPLEAEPQPVRFRIQEDRILKNGELRYFDHPKFGVLAKVVRVEEEEPLDPDADPDNLVGYLIQ